jgi:hypothetical protein
MTHLRATGKAIGKDLIEDGLLDPSRRLRHFDCCHG